ncbi:uncharacterized protein BX663DRAFT_553941 [Cokeromyces recurvatus]|uniref:uncharacterized protein n=1 Tax=Cokeromyces recurvatus TaxID=90255 RepID=UPI0022200A67|nr:uncharacterized protein BX663DRAFT_553941 [Cokeromyces recurvatus]KAI7900646.1 hypothetical protein BX663DRAFT_553941 [Cokeromyces recurvatus]
MKYSNLDEFSKYASRLSLRKKPKGFHLKNNPWSTSTPKSNLKNNIINDDKQIKKITLRDTILNLSIKKRIVFYEERYITCMSSQTELSAWIKSIKEKGKPSPLTEGYVPPTRSKFSEFLHNTLSIKQRKRMNIFSNHVTTTASTPKSSLSHFFKKTTNNLSTTHKLKQHQQKQHTNSGPTPSPQIKNSTMNQSFRNRFSLTASFTRLSLSSKNNTFLRNTLFSEDNNDMLALDKINPSQNAKPTDNFKILKQQAQFYHDKHIPSAVPQQETINSTVGYQRKAVSNLINYGTTVLMKKNKRPRSQATILPNSPSSIFLDKLQQPLCKRSYSQDSDDSNNNDHSIAKRYPNINFREPQYCHNCILQNAYISSGINQKKEMESTTLHSSTPLSTTETVFSSISTPALAKNSKEVDCQLATEQRPSLTKTIIVEKAKNIIQTSIGKKRGDRVQKGNKNSHEEANNNTKIKEEIKVNHEHYSSITAKPHQKQQLEGLRKKRKSLLVAPSLSTLRLLSQKTQLLKRQSLRA